MQSWAPFERGGPRGWRVQRRVHLGDRGSAAADWRPPAWPLKTEIPVRTGGRPRRPGGAAAQEERAGVKAGEEAADAASTSGRWRRL
jgi:hypothetical protein